MRKVIAFFAVIMLLSGLRLLDNGLLSIHSEGEFSVFRGGTQVRIEPIPVIDRFDGYTRLDTSGDYEQLLQDLQQLNATLLWTEKVTENIVVVYAYAPQINKFEYVHGHKVNIMAAISEGKIAYGCPLLKGSY